MEAFDQPDTLTSCPVRPVSTFAPQALILLNGPFMQEQSKAFAVAAAARGGADDAARVERAYRLALCRPPRDERTRTALDFLAGQTELLRDRLRARLPVGVPAGTPDGVDPAEAAALADFCLALLIGTSSCTCREGPPCSQAPASRLRGQGRKRTYRRDNKTNRIRTPSGRKDLWGREGSEKRSTPGDRRRASSIGEELEPNG